MRVADNIAQIKSVLAGRAELVAVSKMQPAAALQEAMDAGQRVFGENRVQEAAMHWQEHRDSVLYPDLRLHLIGPLQTNKVREAVALFDVIEIVDRPKLAQALGAEMARQRRFLQCYIQVNTGEEPQKAGIIPSDLPDFLTYCRDECRLNIVGLMCIPPVDDPPAVHFAFLAKLAKEAGLNKLSMGMSHDYEIAVEVGATSVRVGSAIFGERPS